MPSPIPILTPSSECNMPDILRLNMWSGPRNVSTALMYSFAQRSDTRVMTNHLTVTICACLAAHPGASEVRAAMGMPNAFATSSGPVIARALYEQMVIPSRIARLLQHTHNVPLRATVDMLPSSSTSSKRLTCASATKTSPLLHDSRHRSTYPSRFS